MKKTLTLVLALAVLLTACLPASAAVTEKGVLPIVDEPITLTVAFPVNPKVEDINTNKLTLWYEEQTGIQLEFIELSTEDTATQVNMLMNSGDLPDIILGYGFPYDVLCGYADAGLIVPLDEQYEKYGLNVYDRLLPEMGDNALSYVTYEDQRWAVPSGGNLITNVYGAEYNRIQTQFLEALGMEMPHTIDELYDFLVAVRDNDVNGNGDPSDEIPMTTYAACNYVFRMLSNAWQYTDCSTYLKVNDDVVNFIGNNEYFKETLEFMKKLVDEKLLDPACFTQDKSVCATLLAQDGNNVGIYACGNMYTETMDSEGEEYQNMRMLPNLEGPYGYKSSLYSPSSVRISGVVTSACENVDAAFRFLDFCLSEEAGISTRVGFEGEQWKVADEGVIGRDGTQAKFSLLTTQEWVQPSTNVIWDSESFIISNVMNGCEAAQTAVKYPGPADIVEWNYVGENTHERLPQLLMSAEDALEYNELQSLIRSAVEEAIAVFVLGDRDMNEFDAYCAELDAMGLQRYIEMAQAAYDNVK